MDPGLIVDRARSTRPKYFVFSSSLSRSSVDALSSSSAFSDAAKSQRFAARMLEKGVYVIGFFYPVVPHGTAHVRTQVSAAHSREDLEFAVNAFAEVNEELK